ncbi:MAG: acetyl-CoA carboxylase biotin carboxyl carrier protein subunit [Deltaproteobacteria bacterium]|jgi:acetyl-CoA carboxylase biotin carboxyl carrier protein|nr:acetyl-CoA carboxylase biotin carboxyl carrier protein subunit [Deltaproteobacteria bacterium]
MAQHNIVAHITGTLWKLTTKVGDEVAEGDTVAILESMKMEMPVEADRPGRVVAISAQEGAPVMEGQTLVTIDET